MTQLFKEVNSSTEKVIVEHIFVLTIPERTDKLARTLAGAALELGRHVVKSIRLVAVATSAGILLWGTARLIESIRRRRRQQQRPRDSSEDDEHQ